MTYGVANVPQYAPARGARRRSAFTLIELLIVITIIGVLAAIGLAVGVQVSKGGKMRATANILSAMEQVLEEYKTAAQSKAPKYYVDASVAPAAPNVFPIFDGRDNKRVLPLADQYDRDRDPAQPSLTLLLLAASRQVALEPMLKNIDPSFIERKTVSASGWVGGTGALQVIPVTGLVIKDAFGNPIRYVHPGFHGGYGDFYPTTSASATMRPTLAITYTAPGAANGTLPTELRRSFRPFSASAPCPRPVGDADEGLSTSERGYFYSAGPDGDPGTRDDNVYLNKPNFPPETTFPSGS